MTVVAEEDKTAPESVADSSMEVAARIRGNMGGSSGNVVGVAAICDETEERAAAIQAVDGRLSLVVVAAAAAPVGTTTTSLLGTAEGESFANCSSPAVVFAAETGEAESTPAPSPSDVGVFAAVTPGDEGQDAVIKLWTS